MKLDALDILCLSPALKQNLQGRYDVRDPAHNRVYGVKAVQGWPIDIRAYDNDYVYDNFTEGDPPESKTGHDGWKDPGDVKWHVGNRMRGNKMLNRWINYPFTVPYVVSDDDSPFGMIKNGQWDGMPHSVRGTKYVLNPPVVKGWGGSVGTIPTWLLQYYYNGRPLVPGSQTLDYSAMETYEFGFDPADPVKRAFGLIHWTLNAKGLGDKYGFVRQNTPSITLRPFVAALGPRYVVAPFLGINGPVP